MPPGGANLGAETYLAVTAYILQSNGATAGAQPLTAITAAPLAAIATGVPAPAAPSAPAALGAPDTRTAPVAPGAPAAPVAPAPPRGLTITGEVKDFRPVTDEMLRNPPPGDWLMMRRNYQAWSHSPLSEITTANVKDLRLAWVWAMNETGANQPTPLVHDGIMYLANTMNVVQALDAATGDLIWENHVGPATIVGFGSMRNMAIAGDKLYFATTDARLVALDARTGKLIWDTVIADRAKGFSNTSGPIVARGKVIQGLQGCDRYREERCFISAYDAGTGKLAWKFHTVARTGEPGGDTWGKLPDLMRAGGDTWIAGSYDPDLDLTYWGIAQAKPWMPVSRGTSVRDAALYTASTVALRSSDGSLAWHAQHMPGESLDLDEVYERVLVDVGADKTLFTIGKAGVLWKYDRRTGPLPRPQRDGLPERLRQHQSKDRRAHLSPRHPRTEDRSVDSRLPKHRGRPQLAVDELSPRHTLAGHSTEPVVHGDFAAQSGIEGGLRGRRRGSQVLRDARIGRQRGEAGRLRRRDAERGVELPAARGLPHRRAEHRRRTRLHRRSRSLLPRLRRPYW